MRKLVLIALALAVAYFAGVASGLIGGRHDAGVGGVESGPIPQQHDTGTTATTGADQALAAAFENRQSNIQVHGSGRVSRVLADDNDGSRHQRFIVQLASGQTLLVAHNIDVATRVASLQAGDDVEFNGEYEWNERGGVVHWTHRDPQGSHVDGWIRHDARTYQ